MIKKRILATLILSFGIMFVTKAAPSNALYEAYYLYLGNYPSEANPGWHENVQGLTHDRDNWFITQTKDLWKIPVTHDLDSVSPTDRGVTRIGLGSVPELVNAGYNHFGDPEYYDFDGQGYVVIPIEDVDNRTPCNGIAVFRAETLEFLALQCLSGQGAAPWVAIGPEGNLYSSNSDDETVRKYSVDWSGLKNRNELIVTPAPPVGLLDEQGSPVTLHSLQGGVISPSGQLLYLVANGIQVFDLTTRQRVQRSTNGAGYFNYEFHPDAPDYEEPEGLTIWDLDDGRAPGIRGQLHVLLLDNDITNADDVYLKHYSGSIYVDRNYGGVEVGTPSKPFRTVVRANNLAWDGAQIKVRAGSYPESVTFSRRVIVTAIGGSVNIGR